MEAVFKNKSLTTSPSLTEAIAAFFRENTPDSAKVFFWKMFQCWALKDCKIKAEITDEEVALFFDQLSDLVAAAYILHQANGAAVNEQKGLDHE